jgi:hypothetical protein
MWLLSLSFGLPRLGLMRLRKRSYLGERQKNASPHCGKGERFLLSEALHRQFVASILYVGLKNVSIEATLEVAPQDTGVSIQQIKSHLKHRGDPQKISLINASSQSKRQKMLCLASSRQLPAHILVP